jgi:ligand-binding sensor domain-containing protein
LRGAAFGLASTEDAIWAATNSARSLDRIDPVTGQVVASVTTGTEPDSVALAAGSLWVGHNGPDLVRVDPGTSEVVARIAAPLASVAEGEGAVWVATMNSVLRVDPATNEVTHTIELPGTRDGTYGIAVGDGAVWAGGPGRVDRIDPASRDIVATVAVEGWKLAVGAGSLWAGGGAGVWRIDTDTNELVARISVPGIESIAWDGTGLWTVGPCCPGNDPYLVQIDPATNAAVSQTPIGTNRPGAEGLTIGHGYVWASTDGDARLWRVPVPAP